MKLIDQCSDIWGETPLTKEEAILWIEKAGRVCYRSEDNIIEGSGQKFVEGIIKRRHLSVIEHSNLVLRTRNKSQFPVNSLKVVQSVFNSKYFSFFIQEDRIYISGNWRAWIEYYNVTAPDYADMITFDNIDTIFECDDYEVVTNPDDVPMPLKAVTVEFKTNRAMTHELVRHRPTAVSQESQRYCRYGELTFIKPLGYDEWEPYTKTVFNNSCIFTEDWYKGLLAGDMSPQQARNVLTNAAYTKIIMTCNIIEWNHIFSLRCGGGADPQMIDLMIPVRDQFNKNGWINYDK